MIPWDKEHDNRGRGPILPGFAILWDMASETRKNDSAWVRVYSDRIGEPKTGDEVVGYWLFLVGVLLGVIGIGLAVVSQPASGVREVAIIAGALGLTSIMIGSVIRFPLGQTATYLSYLGGVVCVLAIAWFAIAFPSGWSPSSGNPWIITLYGAGTAVIAAGGVFVPLVTPSRVEEAEEAEMEARTESSAQKNENRRLEEDLNDLEEENTRLEEELKEARMELGSLKNSKARFELYRDKSDKYRWRLRHRNGQIIASSGENFERRNGAQNGIQSVRRNSFGATLLEKEAAEVEETTSEPVEPESRADFEIYRDKKDQWRWRLQHDNGNIIADGGQGYGSKSNVRRAVRSVRARVGPATYLKLDPTGFEIYPDAEGDWRWRLTHENGNILADSGEGYASRSGARKAVDSIMDNAENMDFEVYEDNAGEFRWRLKSGSNIVADSGEGYESRSGANDAVERVRNYAPESDVLDVGDAAFEIYEDKAGEFRWRLRHRNGNILADGGQGYSDYSGARDGIESVKINAGGADIEETGE